MSGVYRYGARVRGGVRVRFVRTGRWTSSGRSESRGRPGCVAFGEISCLQERFGGASLYGSLRQNCFPIGLAAHVRVRAGIHRRLSEEAAAVLRKWLRFQRAEVPPAERPACRHRPGRQRDGVPQ